jgi:hypothetical protein
MLWLSHNGFGNAGAVALAASKSFPVLGYLFLMWCSIGDEGAVALADSPLGGQLRALALTGNIISEAGKEQLKARLSRLYL